MNENFSNRYSLFNRVPKINEDFDYSGWDGGSDAAYFLSLVDGKSSVAEIFRKGSFTEKKLLSLIDNLQEQKVIILVDDIQSERNISSSSGEEERSEESEATPPKEDLAPETRDVILKLNPRPDWSRLEFTAKHAEIMAQIDGEKDIGWLLDHIDQPPDQTLRMLREMLRENIVFVTGPEDSTVEVEEDAVDEDVAAPDETAEDTMSREETVPEQVQIASEEAADSSPPKPYSPPVLTNDNYQTIIDLAPNPDWSRIQLDSTYGQILSFVNGKNSIEKIVANVVIKPEQTLEYLNNLLSAGIIIQVEEETPEERQKEIIDQFAQPAESEAGEEEWELVRQGNFKDEHFHTLLWELYDAGETGRLIISINSKEKLITFRDGLPIHVKSVARSEYLGNILRAVGHLDNSALNYAVSRAEKENRRLGQVLLGMKLITQSQLDKVLRKQLEMKIMNLFKIDRGEFRFYRGKIPVNMGCHDLSLSMLIYIGVSKYFPSDKKLEESRTIYIDKFVKRNPDSTWQLPPNLSLKHREHFKAIDGFHTLRQLTQISPLSKIQILEFTYELAAARAVNLSDISEKSGKIISSMDELKNIRDYMRSSNYFDRLSIHETELEDKINESHENLIDKFNPEKFPEAQKKLARQIVDMVQEAYDTLIQTDSRREYRKKIFDDSHIHFAADMLGEQGTMALMREDYLEAIEYFRKALDFNHRNGEYMAGLGLATFFQDLKMKKRVSQGLELIKKGIRYSPQSSLCYLYLGYLYRRLGRRQEAIEAFEKAQALDPKELEAQNALKSLK